eukprot:174361_1
MLSKQSKQRIRTSMASPKLGIEAVRIRHESLLNSGRNTNDKMKEIVTILGGTDAILKHFLSNKTEHSLTVDQIAKINDIILDSSPEATRLQIHIQSIYSLHFTIELATIILDYCGNIPSNNLLVHLDASNYDSIHTYMSNDYEALDWRSCHDNITFTLSKYPSTNMPYPTFHDVNRRYGYVEFDGTQILSSNKLFGLYNRDGVTVILVFRPSINPTGNQQFILNFGNAFRGKNTNMEIGIDAGHPYPHTGCFGVHSACSRSTVTKTIIEKDKWYVITMVLQREQCEIYVNGKQESEKIVCNDWTGYGNKAYAPFDIGGRIDGNWVKNTVDIHSTCGASAGNCTFHGDISVVIVYDRVLSKKERNTVGRPLLERFIKSR